MNYQSLNGLSAATMLPQLLLPILVPQIQAVHFKQFVKRSGINYFSSFSYAHNPIFDEAQRLCKSPCRKGYDCDLAFRSLEKEFCDGLSPYSSTSWLPHGKQSWLRGYCECANCRLFMHVSQRGQNGRGGNRAASRAMTEPGPGVEPVSRATILQEESVRETPPSPKPARSGSARVQFQCFHDFKAQKLSR